MAIVTAALTTISVLNELNNLIGSQDPLLVRLNNHTADVPVKFGAVNNLSNMEAHAMPNPWIPSGSISDAHFGASSWTSARLGLEYWFDHKGKIYNLILDYIWEEKHKAHFTLSLKFKNKMEDALELRSETKGETYRTAEVRGDGFIFLIHASGKLIEISMIPE